MDVSAITTNPARTTTAANGTAELTGDDFLELLVTQLVNQDPLAPTSNEELLQQLSSIRDIQLSTTLVDSLEMLTGNQRYGAAAALIGKSVVGRIGDEASGYETVSGLVVGVRFDAQGNVSLELDSGRQLPLERLESVTTPEHTAESLIGRSVQGIDRSRDEPAPVSGIVTGVRLDENGQAVLELDTGESLRMRDLTASV
jgi:flagellar basal-body rod modification protein FlgD